MINLILLPIFVLISIFTAKRIVDNVMANQYPFKGLKLPIVLLAGIALIAVITSIMILI